MEVGRCLTRRRFIGRAALTGGLVVLGSSAAAAGEPAESGVSPAEDLMREHGVLRRLLLVYEEALRRTRGGGPAPAKAVHEAATIIRDFIEQYHEKLEEEHVFPLFRESRELAGLAALLAAQHRAGREVTARVLRQTEGPAGSTPGGDLRAFIRMYRPHAAREDTVLFPALHEVMSADAYAEMGERFEDREHELFGPSGFQGVVARVAALEQGLGIHSLDQFTPSDVPPGTLP